jgi:hypothetical protein
MQGGGVGMGMGSMNQQNMSMGMPGVAGQTSSQVNMNTMGGISTGGAYVVGQDVNSGQVRRPSVEYGKVKNLPGDDPFSSFGSI